MNIVLKRILWNTPELRRGQVKANYYFFVDSIRRNRFFVHATEAQTLIGHTSIGPNQKSSVKVTYLQILALQEGRSGMMPSFHRDGVCGETSLLAMAGCCFLAVAACSKTTFVARCVMHVLVECPPYWGVGS